MTKSLTKSNLRMETKFKIVIDITLRLLNVVTRFNRRRAYKGARQVGQFA